MATPRSAAAIRLQWAASAPHSRQIRGAVGDEGPLERSHQVDRSTAKPAVRRRRTLDYRAEARGRSIERSRHGFRIPTELHFLIAEIALTIGAVDWGTATRGIDPGLVRDTLISALDELESAYAMPDSTPRNSQMTAYVAQAFEEARRSCGG